MGSTILDRIALTVVLCGVIGISIESERPVTMEREQSRNFVIGGNNQSQAHNWKSLTVICRLSGNEVTPT